MTARSAPIPVASLLRPPPAPGTAGGHRSGPDGDPNRAHERARAEPPATTTSHRGSPGGAADPIQDPHKPSVGGLQAEISDMRHAGRRSERRGDRGGGATGREMESFSGGRGGRGGSAVKWEVEGEGSDGDRGARGRGGSGRSHGGLAHVGGVAEATELRVR